MLVWMKMQINSLPLGAAFNAVHKTALSSQTLLYQALQAWRNENETNQTNHRRLASRKGGVWKNESLSESFGSRWASKVKINAYYKTIKVLFDIACMSTCCWGLPKPKYEPFITHNRGTLTVSQGAFTLALLVRTRVRLTSEFGSFGWCERCLPTSGAHPRTEPESA